MTIRVLIAALVLFAVCPACVGQTVSGGKPAAADTLPVSAAGTPEALFLLIEEGVSAGDVSVFSDFIGSTVRLDVRGNQDGYYSANQAVQILRHFFNRQSVRKFRFSRRETGENPYATGGGVFNAGGRSDRIQIYVGLVKAEGRWVISQFNIY